MLIWISSFMKYLLILFLFFIFSVLQGIDTTFLYPVHVVPFVFSLFLREREREKEHEQGRSREGETECEAGFWL